MSNVGRHVRLLVSTVDVPAGTVGVIVREYMDDDRIYYVRFEGLWAALPFFDPEFDPRSPAYKIEVIP